MEDEGAAGRRRTTSLGGTWGFVHQADGRAREVAVPGPWQAAFADLRHRAGRATYARRFARPEGAEGREVALRFGAASYLAEVRVNGERLLAHEGGWLPFEAVVPAALLRDDNLLEVECTLPGGDRSTPGTPFAEIPHGKQSWYGPVGGLWQDVALEVRDPCHLAHCAIGADPLTGRVAVRLEVAGAQGATARLAVVAPGGEVVARAALPCDGSPVTAALDVPDVRLWSPDDPALYALRVTLDRDGPRDATAHAFGFRRFEAEGGRLLLNGAPFYMRAALDQDYWPVGIATPPSLEALEDQIRKAKALGLNMLRLHIKVPDPRYYEVADRLGMLVWTEIPNVATLTPDSARRLKETMEGILRRDGNHPSIVIWSLVNEDWGTRLKEDPSHRAWLAGLYAWLKREDPTRLVVDNSPCHGNVHVETDIADFHWYRSVPERRQEWDALTAEFAAGAPWAWAPDARRRGDEPLVCSEFGVWGLPQPDEVRIDGEEPWWMETGGTWGDGTAGPRGIEARYASLGLEGTFGPLPAFVGAAQAYQHMNLKYQIESMRAHPSIMGYVITELTDTHWESNGLLDMNRNPRAFAPRFAEVNGEACLVPRIDRHAGRAGEPFAFPLLVATGGARLRGAEVRWRAEGAEGTLPVPDAGPCEAVAAGEVAFRLPGGPSRMLAVEMTLLQDGREVTRNRADVALYGARDREGLPSVSAAEPELAAWLAAAGHDLRPEGEVRVARALAPADVAAMQAGARYLVLADGSVPTHRNLRLDEPGREQPFIAAVDGTPGLPGPPETLLPNIVLQPRHRSMWRGDWIAGFSWIRRDGPFAGLPGGPLLDLSFDRVVPRFVMTGFRDWEYHGLVQAGLVVGWVHKPATLIAERRVGRGGLVATTFRLTAEAPGIDPVAEALLDACLRLAAAIPVAGPLPSS